MVKKGHQKVCQQYLLLPLLLLLLVALLVAFTTTLPVLYCCCGCYGFCGLNVARLTTATIPLLLLLTTATATALYGMGSCQGQALRPLLASRGSNWSKRVRRPN